jgi:hypothetical protein
MRVCFGGGSYSRDTVDSDALSSVGGRRLKLVCLTRRGIYIVVVAWFWRRVGKNGGVGEQESVEWRSLRGHPNHRSHHILPRRILSKRNVCSLVQPWHNEENDYKMVVPCIQPTTSHQAAVLSQSLEGCRIEVEHTVTEVTVWCYLCFQEQIKE